MELAALARRVAKRLQRVDQRVVFAESCTAGLISARLSAVPGISEHHCGSLVTYRNRSKQDWLGVPAKLLEQPGPVSEIVARKMAAGALARTREADIAVSITGHLGPAAPARLDGLVFVGVAVRGGKRVRVDASRHRLRSTTRQQRQREAAHLAFQALLEVLD